MPPCVVAKNEVVVEILQKEAAALKSRRRVNKRVKGLLYDGFFLLPSPGR